MGAYQALMMVGQTVHTVCRGKTSRQFVRTCIHDFEGDQSSTQKLGHNFHLNFTFDDVKAEDHDGVLIPGGRAVEYIRLNPKVLDIVRHFVKAKKPIAQICHGAQLLAAAGALEGKKCSAYPGTSVEVRLAKGTFVDLPMDQDITEGELVS